MRIKGNFLKDARLKKELSQEYISDILKISQSKYSRLEKGQISFCINELSTLIDILELNPLEVIDFTEKQQVFINSSYSGNVNSKINGIDKDAIRELIQDELRKTKST